MPCGFPTGLLSIKKDPMLLALLWPNMNGLIEAAKLLPQTRSQNNLIIEG